MAKYDPLSDYLAGLDRNAEHSLSFARIEHELGFALPASARKHQAWWANQRNFRHVQANAWLDAGWRTHHLDLTGCRVTFRAVAVPRAPKLAGIVAKPIAPLTIAQAKRAVALQLGVRPADVSITVRRPSLGQK